MKQTSYFKTAIGKQTLSGMLTLGSLPLLLFSRSHNGIFEYLGLMALFTGMLSVPVMSLRKKRFKP